MAVSPIHPVAAVPVLPATDAMPAAPAEPATTVTPAEGATNPNDTRDATSQQRQPSSPQGLEKALEDINSQMKAWSTQLQFEIDPDIHQVVVSVVDSETGDVLRTIPSDAVLRIARMIVRLQGNAVETSA